eukprot:GDKI01001285.1.p1 GENE.GDKI01001285.1~~GDKI01001285.1.p1  ORF type:complete len:575 (+),score=135.99 GDKI01001285.1:57-1781(+)
MASENGVELSKQGGAKDLERQGSNTNSPRQMDKMQQKPTVARGEMCIAPHKYSQLEKYICYGLSCLSVVIVLIKGLQASDKYADVAIPGVVNGWLFDRKYDNYDAQWRAFRGSIHLLIGGSIIFCLISKGIRHVQRNSKNKSVFLLWQMAFGMGYCLYLHGSGFIFALTLALINFGISFLCSKQGYIGPVATWVFNVGILFLNEAYHGYSFAMFSPSLAWLDDYGGVTRWSVSFNLVTLRMISFNMDYHWMVTNRTLTKKTDAVELDPLSYRARQETHQPSDRYNLLAYLSYLFYAPLYIAGPTTPFNAWVSQIYVEQTAMDVSDIAMYALKWFAELLFMDIFLHFFHVNAISSNTRNVALWGMLTPTEIGMCAIWTLMFIWLKFLLLWRFFRLWALCDGIEPPENMNRCVLNNYSMEQFWRSWHRAFNQWLLRYIYIPLGGLKYKLLNVFVVFTYVAIWHDITWKLLSWAWLITLFIAPELGLKWLFSGSRFVKLRSKWYFYYLCVFAGAMNVFMMMTANLVGFSFGTEGLRLLGTQLVHDWEGVKFLGMCVVVFFTNVNTMMLIRSGENKNY